MKKNNGILLACLLTIMLGTSGCAIAGGIFKAGMWVGILVVVLVVGLVIWLVGKAKK